MEKYRPRSPILEPDIETHMIQNRGEHHSLALKVMLCTSFFCILRPVTLKNKPRSPTLEPDLESSFNGFQAMLLPDGRCMQIFIAQLSSAQH